MAEKTMRLRYPAYCRSCRKRIPAGAYAVWLGKGRGAKHVDCNAGTVPAATAEMKAYSVDFSEVKDTYLAIADGKTNSVIRNSENRMIAKRWPESHWTNGGWSGATSEEMRKWLASGYPVSTIEGINPDLVHPRKRRRLLFQEDGELQLDLALSGFDYPFIEWEKRETKPGMSCEIEVDFNANVDARIISQYEIWIARALQTLEISGYDLEVNLKITTDDSFPALPGKGEILIRVKRENEATDFAAWSAMFSPGGFRHLGFTSIVMAAEHFKTYTTIGLGSASPHGKWEVWLDREARKLKMGVPLNPTEFPEAQMTAMLQAVLKESIH